MNRIIAALKRMFTRRPLSTHGAPRQGGLHHAFRPVPVSVSSPAQEQEKARTRQQIRETRARVERLTDLQEIRQRKGAH